LYGQENKRQNDQRGESKDLTCVRAEVLLLYCRMVLGEQMQFDGNNNCSMWKPTAGSAAFDRSILRTLLVLAVAAVWNILLTALVEQQRELMLNRSTLSSIYSA
jgi:hypothetical protein